MEDVFEALQQAIVRRLVHIGRDADALVQEEGAQVVYAVRLVGMVVREQRRVHAPDAGGRRLKTEIRGGVDDDRSLVGPTALP